MHFVPSDAGPYWMTEAEKLSNRKDSPSGKKIKRFRNKGDLLKELQSKGVSAKGRKDELQILCKQKNIPIEEELNEVVEGWEGKLKGMLQILWEQCFINHQSSIINPAKKGRLHAPWQEGCFQKGNTRKKSEASDKSSD
jgi:hypothetical protein